jgi:hypothetical protein
MLIFLLYGKLFQDFRVHAPIGLRERPGGKHISGCAAVDLFVNGDEAFLQKHVAGFPVVFDCPGLTRIGV